MAMHSTLTGVCSINAPMVSPHYFPLNSSPSPNSGRLAMIATLLTLRPVYLPHTTHIKFEALSPLEAGPRLLFHFLLASLKIPHIVVPKKVQSPLSFLPMCIDLPSVLLTTGRITNCLQPTSRMHIHSAANHYHEQHCQLEIREPRTQTPDPRPSSRERDARQTHPEGNMQGSRLNSSTPPGPNTGTDRPKLDTRVPTWLAYRFLCAGGQPGT